MSNLVFKLNSCSPSSLSPIPNKPNSRCSLPFIRKPMSFANYLIYRSNIEEARNPKTPFQYPSYLTCLISPSSVSNSVMPLTRRISPFDAFCYYVLYLPLVVLLVFPLYQCQCYCVSRRTSVLLPSLVIRHLEPGAIVFHLLNSETSFMYIRKNKFRLFLLLASPTLYLLGLLPRCRLNSVLRTINFNPKLHPQFSLLQNFQWILNSNVFISIFPLSPTHFTPPLSRLSSSQPVVRHCSLCR